MFVEVQGGIELQTSTLLVSVKGNRFSQWLRCLPPLKRIRPNVKTAYSGKQHGESGKPTVLFTSTPYTKPWSGTLNNPLLSFIPDSTQPTGLSDPILEQELLPVELTTTSNFISSQTFPRVAASSSSLTHYWEAPLVSTLIPHLMLESSL
jgi:hypothetical protein